MSQAPALNIVAPDKSARLSIFFNDAGEPITIGALDPGKALGVMVTDIGPHGVLVLAARYFDLIRKIQASQEEQGAAADGVGEAPAAEETA